MEDQKLENLLNLALGATDEEREKSLNLDVGYHPIDREWELIIKYSGNLDQVRDLASQVLSFRMSTQSFGSVNPELIYFQIFRR